MLCEIVYRGYSHISMFVSGGISCVLIQLFCNSAKRMKKCRLWVKCLCGSAIITLIELLTGLIVNRKLGLGIWDYSSLPCNFMGRICLRLSSVWFFLTVPALGLCRLVCFCTPQKKADRELI